MVQTFKVYKILAFFRFARTKENESSCYNIVNFEAQKVKTVKQLTKPNVQEIMSLFL